MQRSLKVKLHPNGVRWINPDHIVWLDDSVEAGWAAAVNPSTEGITVSPTQTPVTTTAIGLIDKTVIIAAHPAALILHVLGLRRWQADDGMETAERSS